MRLTIFKEKNLNRLANSYVPNEPSLKVYWTGNLKNNMFMTVSEPKRALMIFKLFILDIYKNGLILLLYNINISIAFFIRKYYIEFGTMHNFLIFVDFLRLIVLHLFKVMQMQNIILLPILTDETDCNIFVERSKNIFHSNFYLQ